MYRFFSGFVLAVILAGCGADPVDPVLVFPDAEPLKHRHRNHSMVESPDGALRVYAEQKGDYTDLVLMRRQAGGGWSAPQVLDLPRLQSNTSPRFDPDNPATLYYSSDGRHPDRPGRKDLNVWRVELAADGVGVPEVLPDIINTGSHEDGFAPGPGNIAVFSSTRLGGEGGYDLYIATQRFGVAAEGSSWEVAPFAHNTQLADSHPALSPDGRFLVWYAQQPRDRIYGSADLFLSHRTEAGWSAPRNLGPAINSDLVDYGPGFSGDGETLFYSREGILYEVSASHTFANAGFVAPAQ